MDDEDIDERLHEAIDSNDYDATIAVLREIDPVEREQIWNRLHSAVELGSPDAARALIDSGFDPNQPYGANKVTPLQIAILGDDMRTAAVLVSHGADALALLPDGRSLLDLAYEEQLPKAVVLLPSFGVPFVKYAGDQDALRWAELSAPAELAVDGGNRATLVSLLTNGLDPNVLVYAGAKRRSLLHTAAMRCDVDSVKMLLDRGADPDSQQPTSLNTPLHVAVMFGCSAVVKCLVEAGCDVRLKSKVGFDAYDLAARAGKRDILELLAAQR